MRILLTGATGMLGRAITRRLLSRGDTVFAHIYDAKRGEAYEKDFPAVTAFHGELSELAGQQRQMGRLDGIIHLAWAGTTSHDRLDSRLQEGNIASSIAVYALGQRLGARYFFFAGSQAEYGHLGSQGPEKEDAVSPETAYGKAKCAFGEWLKERAGQDGIRYVHARIFSVYGPEDRPDSLLSQLVAAERGNGKIQLGPCTQKWNFLYADDFASLLDMSLDDPAFHGEVNFASPETKPLREFIAEGFDASHFSFSEVNPNPEGLLDLNPDLSRLLSLCRDYAFLPFREGVKRLGK